MYKSVKGIYENGQIVLNEEVPIEDKVEVIVTFLPKEDEKQIVKKGVRLGSLAGKGYSIPDDFNEPLDDLKDYM